MLRRVLGMHAGNSAKPWQRQVGLYTRSDYEKSNRRQWGVVATVLFYEPGAGEHRLEAWAPTWREAIELAVWAAIEL
jgi:hypothetical protein